MRIFKRIASKWYVTSSLALMLFVVSCQSSGSTYSSVSRFSGEELFAGLFFGEGEVVEIVPELHERSQLKSYLSSEEEVAGFRAFQVKAIEAIRKENPQFFATFKADIQSGDHLRIQKAMQNSSEVLIGALEDMYGIKKKDFIRLNEELNAKTNIREVVLNKGTIDRKQFNTQVGTLALSYLDVNKYSDSSKEEAAAAVLGPIAIAVAAVAVLVITLAWVMVDETEAAMVRPEHPGTILTDRVVNSIAIKLRVLPTE